MASAIALWWAHEKPAGRVVLTATTNPQIRNILWKEIRRLVHAANVSFPKVAALPSLGIQWDDGREIIGFSTKESERMAGISGAELLFIVDEASGVPEDIFDAIEGNRAGGAHILMLGNPTQPAGQFYDSFHSKASLYETFHISSVEAANNPIEIPGLATKDWVEEKLREWGPDDPRYQVRVGGDFADSAESTVIPLAVVSAAQDRWHDERASGSRLELGVDVARFGDDETVVVARRGNKVLEIVARSQLDGPQVKDLVLAIAKRHHAKGEQKPLAKVDNCGVGLGVVYLLRQSSDVQVLGVNAAERSSQPDEYVNLRSQLWFGLSDWLRDGGCIPIDSKLEAELLCPRYDFDARNRRRVEKKDEIKKRIHRSPDRADALALAVHMPRARLVRLTGDVKHHTDYRLSSGRGF